MSSFWFGATAPPRLRRTVRARPSGNKKGPRGGLVRASSSGNECHLVPFARAPPTRMSVKPIIRTTPVLPVSCPACPAGHLSPREPPSPDAAQTRRALPRGQALCQEISPRNGKSCRMLQTPRLPANPRGQIRTPKSGCSPGIGPAALRGYPQLRTPGDRKRDYPLATHRRALYIPTPRRGRLPLPPSGRIGRGCIAQLVEQLTLNQPVLGSNPRAPTIFFYS